ncbi:MAG: hypothetical protein U0231_12935 [Nitrospiraceae bacterium]
MIRTSALPETSNPTMRLRHRMEHAAVDLHSAAVVHPHYRTQDGVLDFSGGYPKGDADGDLFQHEAIGVPNLQNVGRVGPDDSGAQRDSPWQGDVERSIRIGAVIG